MKNVFDAENALEAHMIVHLLERSGIEANVVGEHLQGGIGELPASGNIRVVVEPDDVRAAREVIAEWEASRRIEPSTETKATRKNPYPGVIAFFSGVGIASAFLLWVYNSPVSTRTADYNRDGYADEWVYWRANHLSRVDVDRNHDGEVDSRYDYSVRNSVETAEFDNDFDGAFEYVSQYRYAQPRLDEIDVDGDGKPDRRYHYVHGVLTKIEMFRPSTRSVRKSQTYEKGVKLIEARWDSDDDGVLDTLITYGPFEEELERSRIPGND